ncbi:MAG: hypothetical protein A2Z93_01770 [Curvibacter sp. GWA2_64_110]|nr:MAG: hypothetical protein A2Z93_01770 [Curvibacter sp. GWA2_64_110]HCY15489.1 hypothetical protein [Curvibacter sp.]
MSNAKPHPNHFFVDNKKYETEKTSLNGGEIKVIAQVPANYQLFLEAHGNDPDRMISDGESITIGTPPHHFYAVPPATFGSK